jgi:hypothetical protein
MSESALYKRVLNQITENYMDGRAILKQGILGVVLSVCALFACVARDYGAAPKGLLLIDAQGHYSLQIFKAERPSTPIHARCRARVTSLLG